MHGERSGPGSWLLAGLLRVIAFVIVVMLVWVAYVYLYAYQPDLLGWCYTLLRPATIWLYQLIDLWLPDAVKYKVSAGLTDELGPRALFLLVLGGIGHAVVSSVFWMIVGLVRLVSGGRGHPERSRSA